MLPHVQYRIMIVDDNADELFILERAIRKVLGNHGTVSGLRSGNEAIRYLAGEGVYGDRIAHPFPSFLMTDLRMADGNGFDVLAFLQSNPGWAVIPRVVCSCSNDPDDIKTAYVLGASAYHQKPISPSGLSICMESLITYWMSCELPLVDENGQMEETQHSGKLGERYALPARSERMRTPGS